MKDVSPKTAFDGEQRDAHERWHDKEALADGPGPVAAWARSGTARRTATRASARKASQYSGSKIAAER